MAKPAALDSTVVLDSTAVLAVLFCEPGAAPILDLLPGSLLSAVNLAEIHTYLLQSGHSAAQTWNRVLSMGFEVVPFTQEQARIAAEIAAKARPYRLSLADRACFALAIQRTATVYTTSPAWKSLPLNVEVVVIA